MVEIIIAIDELKLEQLRQRASKLGLSASELVLKSIDDMLSVPEEEFVALVREILAQNAELYRRLA